MKPGLLSSASTEHKVYAVASKPVAKFIQVLLFSLKLHQQRSLKAGNPKFTWGREGGHSHRPLVSRLSAVSAAEYD